jgi:hypothetical protein
MRGQDCPNAILKFLNIIFIKNDPELSITLNAPCYRSKDRDDLAGEITMLFNSKERYLV